MMRFEDLEVWKRAARLSADLYKQLRDLKDFGFKDQITKSALNFLTYAKGSCGELRCQIYIGMDIEYIPKNIGKKWIQESIEISSMLASLMKTKKGFIKNSLSSIVSFFL